MLGCGAVERGQGTLGPPYGSAVHALQQSLTLELAQIAPNGFRGHFETAGEIADLHPTVCVEKIHDAAMPISRGVHLDGH